MHFIDTHLGLSTADAESVALQHDGSDLVLTFVDWQERTIRHEFEEVLAFKWGQDTGGAPRDDQTYIVEGSEWLAHEAGLAEESPDRFVHYKLCFNAVGVLDVLARSSND